MARGRQKGSKNKKTIEKEKTEEKNLDKMIADVGGVETEKSKEDRGKTHITKLDLIRCFKCGSSDDMMLSSKAFPHRSMKLDGRMIVGIRIQRRRCNKCSQVFFCKLPLL